MWFLSFCVDVPSPLIEAEPCCVKQLESVVSREGLEKGRDFERKCQHKIWA